MRKRYEVFYGVNKMTECDTAQQVADFIFASGLRGLDGAAWSAVDSDPKTLCKYLLFKFEGAMLVSDAKLLLTNRDVQTV